MPFKYGIATMTSTPHALLRLRVQIDDQKAVGIAADHLPPKWFTKDPARPIAEEVEDMLHVIEHAAGLAVGTRAFSAFDAWLQVYGAQDEWGKAQSYPSLLTHFGTSLVERALIEAVCKATKRSFGQVLRSHAFGLRLEDIHIELIQRRAVEFLPDDPLRQVIARHTVGLADPLTETDIAPEERLDDGLPQALVACIRHYGLRHFKIKVSGQLDRDRERLRRIADVLRAHAPADYAFSFDGNEQFHAVADFRTFWDALRREPALADFLGHLLFVEQPFHRQVALQPQVAGLLADWPERPPIIIDESDGDLDSLPQALQMGYAGTSHKNCKGIFKGVANACLLAHRREREPDRAAILSGEDLANIGPVALLQDLAVCASLGISSVERNGHHYFAGLSMFPEYEQGQILRCHGDLYGAARDGWPTLTIADGQLNLDSVTLAPFGVGFEVDVRQFTPLEDWPRIPRAEAEPT